MSKTTQLIFFLIIICFLFAGCRYEKNYENSNLDSTRIKRGYVFLHFSRTYYQLHSPKTFYDSTIKVDSNNIPLNRKQFYFPLELFPETKMEHFEIKLNCYISKQKVISKQPDLYVNKWYSEYLFAMREPLLFNKKFDKEIYRFTWLRSFHDPIVVRIEKKEKQYSIYWKVLKRSNRFKPYNLVVNESKLISKKDWDVFKYLLSKSGFWVMEIGKAVEGYDGAEWILEAAEPNRYKVVTVWSFHEGSFGLTCKYLLSLTGMVLNKEEIY